MLQTVLAIVGVGALFAAFSNDLFGAAVLSFVIASGAATGKLAFDSLVRRLVGHAAPPSLVGMLTLFGVMAPLASLRPSVARRLHAFFAPAATFLNNWTPCFWVPSLGRRLRIEAPSIGRTPSRWVR